MTTFTGGLEPRHWNLLTNLLVKPLHDIGCTLSVFGSRARGDNLPFSDLDILIEGEVTRGMISAIAEQLEESRIPIRVDLVLAQDLAESYRAGILRERIVLPARLAGCRDGA